MREKRCVLIEKLMSESHFIIPVENTVTTEIWTNLAMCVGTSGTINGLYSKFHRCRRSVYNISAGTYWILLCIVIPITTRAESRAVEWKWKNVQ